MVPIAEAFAVTLLAVVFLTAGVSKWRALDTFEGVVQNFRLLPERAVRPVAYTLPVVELAAAVALLVPASRSFAGWLLAALLCVFTLAVVMNLLRGRREIDCGCFSSELKQTLSWWLVARNVALAGLALWIVSDVAAVHATAWAPWLLGGVAAVMTALIYVAGVTMSAVARDAAARRTVADQQ